MELDSHKRDLRPEQWADVQRLARTKVL